MRGKLCIVDCAEKLVTKGINVQIKISFQIIQGKEEKEDNKHRI